MRKQLVLTETEAEWWAEMLKVLCERGIFERVPERSGYRLVKGFDFGADDLAECFDEVERRTGVVMSDADVARIFEEAVAAAEPSQ